MKVFAGLWGCLLIAVGCVLWLDRRDDWEHAWLYLSLPLICAGGIAWELWTHKGQTLEPGKEFREALLAPRVLLLSAAWLLLGLVPYMDDGNWAYLTLPLFAVAGAWLQARKRQRERLVDHAGSRQRE